MNISNINQNFFVPFKIPHQGQAEAAKVNNFEDALNKAAENKNEKELKKACHEFESYFINLMFKEMRKTIHRDDGVIPVSNAQMIFEDMYYDEVSHFASFQGQGIGLADMMFQQLYKDNVYDEIPKDALGKNKID